MLGVGTSRLSADDRRSQLFKMGGWVTLTIGLLTSYGMGTWWTTQVMPR